MNVLTRMSTKGAALSRTVLCDAKGVHSLKHISRRSTCLSGSTRRHRHKVAVFSGRTELSVSHSAGTTSATSATRATSMTYATSATHA